MRSLKTGIIRVLMVCFCCFSTVSWGQSGTIIKTIPAPNYPYGLAFDGASLWVGTSSTNDNKIWKLNPENGAIQGSITVPFVPSSGSYTVKAMAHDGANLWVFMDLPSANHPDKFYKVDPSSGAVLKTLNSPENNYIGGMAYYDDHIWYTQYYASNTIGRDVIIKMDTLGVPQDTIVSVGEQPMGIAYNGTNFWCAEDTGFGATRQEVYEYNPADGSYTGNFIDNPTDSPRDMTFDGQYFWLVHYQTTNSLIYQFDTRGGTPSINVSADEMNFSLTEIGQMKTFVNGINNPGTADLTIDTLIFSNDAFSSNLSGFPLTLAPDSGVVMEISFAPVIYGTINATLTIRTNDPVTPEIIVDLSGKGLYPEPTAVLGATSHDFGSVWVSGEGVGSWPLKIVNQGFVPLTVSGLATGSSNFSVNGPSLPFEVGRDDTVNVTVWFTPTAASNYQDTLTVSSDDPSDPNLTVALSGSGTAGPFNTGFQFWQYQVVDNPQAGSFQEYEVDGLRAINDITGDGVSEVVVATENYMIICVNGASSGNADTLWTFTSYISNSSAGSIGGNFDFGVQDALAIAEDLNDDGYNDVVIATGGGNEHVYAIDGTNGDILWEFGTNDPNSFGLGDFEAVDAQRDFTNDGVVDVLAIAGGNETGTGYKSAYLFNGASGAVEWSYNYPGPNLSFGKTIISIDDVNNDNVPDAVIGVGNNGSDDKKAYCLDGATGFPVWDFPAITAEYNPKEILELPISGETPDVIVAEYFSKIFRVDGETGTEMWMRNLGGLSGIIEMDRIGDINEDGVDDILVASFAAGATCLSGADGDILWQYPMAYQNGIVAVPDITGDGIEEVWVGSGTNATPPGKVHLLSGKGDSLLFDYTFPSNQVNAVAILPSIDGNNTFELVGASDEGLVLTFSGGEDPLAIGEDEIAAPTAFALDQNYPNPFNPITNIGFAISDLGFVQLKVYDITGRLVKTLVSGNRAAGNYNVQWDATNSAGEKVGSGIYFYKLTVGDFQQVKKMMLIK